MPDAEPNPSKTSRVVGAALVAGGLGYLAIEALRDRGGDRTAHHLVPLLAALTGADLVRPRQPESGQAGRRAARRGLDRVLSPLFDR